MNRINAAATAMIAGLFFLGTAHAATFSFAPLGDLPGGNFESRGRCDLGRWLGRRGRQVDFKRPKRLLLDRSRRDGFSRHSPTSPSYAWAASADGWVCHAGQGVGSQAALWSAGVATPLPFYTAYGVSGDGTVVVGDGSGQSSIQAIHWTSPTGAVGLGSLFGGQYSVAHAVSADGLVIVGSSGSTAAGSLGEAFRWTSDTGMVGLGDLPGGFSPIPLPWKHPPMNPSSSA